MTRHRHHTREGQTEHPRTTRTSGPTYFECPECGFLSADVAFGAGETPCPFCAADGDSRRLYPTERLHRLDDRIRRYHEEGESEIVVILVAAFLEAILEDIIDRILAAKGADVSVRQVVLDGQRAVGGRIGRLFPHLTGEQFEDAAAELGYRKFPLRWRDLRAVRNAFIHDSPFNGPQETIDQAMAREAMTLLDQAYRLFVLINNRFAASTHAPRCHPADGL
ncbi:MAG TPA: hypothetical protein VFH17_03145 [Coriobacteriia bacterium]|nr:hypothetical protein [Coriobacteriia bacterium]